MFGVRSGIDPRVRVRDGLIPFLRALLLVRVEPEAQRPERERQTERQSDLKFASVRSGPSQGSETLMNS